MDSASKIAAGRERLKELQLENHLLRETFALQCQELQPTLAMAERGYNLAGMLWQNRSMVSKVIKFFSARPKTPKES